MKNCNEIHDISAFLRTRLVCNSAIAFFSVCENADRFQNNVISMKTETYEYDGISLKTGKYDEIVNRLIERFNERVDVKFENIQNIFRIKREVYNPLVDEFIIETDDEYIMFLWATTA